MSAHTTTRSPAIDIVVHRCSNQSSHQPAIIRTRKAALTTRLRTAKATGDTYILDRLEAGIILYRAKRDAPLSPHEREMWSGRAERDVTDLPLIFSSIVI